MAVGDGAAAAAEAEARRVDHRVSRGYLHALIGHVHYLGDHLDDVAALAHAGLGDVGLQHDVGLVTDEVGYYADIGLDVVLADVGVADYSAADAADKATVLALPGGHAPALPLVLPAELLRRCLYGLDVVDGVRLPLATVAPGVDVALADVVLLVALDGVEAARAHGAAYEQREAGVELLAAVAADDAGGLLVRDDEVGVEVPVGALAHDELSLADADAYLALGGVAQAAGVDRPLGLDGPDDAVGVHAYLRVDLAAEAGLEAAHLLGPGLVELHGAAGLHGQHRCGGDDGDLALLVAVGAADVEGVDVHVAVSDDGGVGDLADVA